MLSILLSRSDLRASRVSVIPHLQLLHETKIIVPTAGTSVSLLPQVTAGLGVWCAFWPPALLVATVLRLMVTLLCSTSANLCRTQEQS